MKQVVFITEIKYILWNSRERSFRKVGKTNLQWIKQNPKIHREKQKKKWAKQAREKETFTLQISSARALSRLFSSWPFDEVFFLNVLRNMS